MLYLLLAVFAALIVLADQAAKYFTCLSIPVGAQVAILPGIFHLTNLRNTGAAFSMLAGKTWFFLLLTVVFFALVAVCVAKKWLRHPLSLWALAAVCGGAVGNLIDRVTLGYVVDMIEVEFLNFAVFNVADCFITCGAIVLVIAVLFVEKDPKKTEDKHDPSV